MDKATKKSRIRRSALIVCCAICLLAGVCFASITANAAISYSGLFDQKTGVSVSPITDDSGISLMPYQENASVDLLDSTSGVFTMDFSVTGTANFTVNFRDESGEEIAACVEAKMGEIKVYALAENEKVGIYYYHNSAVGLTATNNAKSVYTVINSGERYTLKFDPTSMKLTVSNGTVESLVWDFSTANNDGREVGFTVDPFGYYDVSATFTKVGDYTLNLHKLNGVAMGKLVFSFDGPVITVSNDRNMQVGQAFYLPQPLASDFLDGKAETVFVEAYMNGKLFMKKTEYVEGLSVTPTTTGKCRFVYSATDNHGNESKYELSVLCSNDTENSVWNMEQLLLNQQFGVGSQLYIPHVTFQSNYQSGKKACVVTVMKDGAVISGMENVDAGFVLDLSAPGSYKLVYSTEGKNHNGEYVYEFVVSEDLPAVPALNYPDTMVGESFEFVGIQANKVEQTLHYPSGKTASENCVLDEAGNYRVEYTVNGKVYCAQFTVSKPLMADSDDSSAYYGKSPYADEYGLNMMISGSDTYWLNQIIDLSDNTKSDTLIEFYMTPSVKGFQDLDMLEFYLMDAYDESNYLTIRISHNASNYVSYTKVAASNGQPLSGWEGYGSSKPRWWTNGSQWGSFSYACLSANAEYRGEPMNYSFKLFFDNEERALYYQLVPGNNLLVADLDDDTCFSTLWDGFSTGEVYLGVKGGSYVSTGATMFIRELDGVDLSSNYAEDTVQPNLYVDMDGYTDNIPQGVVGQSYPLFGAECSDAGSNATLSVYVQHVDSKKEYPITNNSFTPDQTGRYALVYRAQDGFGCISEQTVYVTVNAKKTPMSITVDPVSNVIAGQRYIFAEPTTSGGSGRMTWQLEVKENGNWNAISSGHIFTKAGSYDLRYRAVDYIGNEVVQEFKLTVKYSDKPVFGDPVQYPAYLVDGDTYTTLYQNAKFYKDGVSGEDCDVVLTITDKYGERIIGEDYFNAYVDKSGDTVKLTYTATYGDTVQTMAYEIPVIRLQYVAGTNYANYMHSENMSIKHDNEFGIGVGILENGSAEWIKNLVADGFNLTFTVNSDNGHTGKIVMYLYDSVDVSQRIKLVFVNDNGVCKLSVNDQPAVAIAGDFNGGNVSVGFDNNLFQIYDSDLFRKTVTETADGDTFQGFKSGKVRFSMEFEEVKGTPRLYISQLGNQSLRLVVGNPDRAEPMASLMGSYDRVVNIGTTVKVLDCVYADILNTSASVKLSVMKDFMPVTATDGTLLDSVELDNGVAPYYVKLDGYGNYTFVYYVVDGNNNRYQMMKQVAVLMTDAPTIQVDGTLAEKYTVGSTVYLPSASAQDVAGEAAEVVVIYELPSGVMRGLMPEDKLVLEEKGEYTLRYYTVDKNGNFAEKVFTFVVE